MLQSITEYYRVLQSISSASTWTNFWACFLQSCATNQTVHPIVQCHFPFNRISSRQGSVADPNINRAVVGHTEESYADHRTSAPESQYRELYSSLFLLESIVGRPLRVLFCPERPFDLPPVCPTGTTGLVWFAVN